MIYTLIFGIAIKVDTKGQPYALFAFSGMFVWVYFAAVMGNAGNSIINAQGIVKKIYFPRLIIPLSKALVSLVDFGINICLVLIIFMFYQFVPSVHIIFFPCFILILMLASLGVGIWLSALSLRFRDFQQIGAFALQIGVYLSPVAYPSSLIPEKFRLYYFLNPMAGIIESVRWSIFGGNFDYLYFISFFVAIVLFVSSLFYFRKVERIMADII